MFQNKIVRAASLQRATARAASKLGTSEQNVALIAQLPTDKSNISAFLFVVREPGIAVVSFAVNDDATAVSIAQISGRNLSAAQARAYLSLLKITHGLDAGAFDAAVEAWRQTRAVPSTPFASVSGARYAKTIRPLASLEGRLLTAGTAIAKLVPTSERFTVFGTPLVGSAEPPLSGPIRVSSGTVVAEVDGIATLGEDGGLAFQPLVFIDEAQTTCTVSVPPTDAHGAPLDRTSLLQRIQGQGVLPRFFDLGAIDRALAAASSQGQTQHGVVAARGTAVVQGRDGYLEVVVGGAKELVEDDTLHVNLYERSSLVNVSAGQLLAKLHPPTPGQDGESLRGERTQARAGAPIKATGGPGVTVDGSLIHAARDGALSVRDNKVSVVDVYIVDGNVDHQTGSLRFNTGSILIRGSVCPRFSVRAGNDIFIEGSVDGGTLKAAGNIVVKGMIVGGHESTIKASGTVVAQGILNAHVEAGGDITVQQEISHSTVSTEGKLVVKQRDGWICGGTVEATHGVEAGRVGAPAQNPTTIQVGIYNDEIRSRMALHARLSEKLKDASAELRSFLETASGRPSVRRSKLESACASLEARLAKITRQIQALNRQLPPPVAEVRFGQSIYPGVLVEIRGLQFPVLRSWGADRIHVDPETRIICLASTGGDLSALDQAA